MIWKGVHSRLTESVSCWWYERGSIAGWQGQWAVDDMKGVLPCLLKPPQAIQLYLSSSSSAFNVMVALTRSSLPWVPHTWMSGTNPLQNPRAWFRGTHKWAIFAALLGGRVSRIAGNVVVFGPLLHRGIELKSLRQSSRDGYSVSAVACSISATFMSCSPCFVHTQSSVKTNLFIGISYTACSKDTKQHGPHPGLVWEGLRLLVFMRVVQIKHTSANSTSADNDIDCMHQLMAQSGTSGCEGQAVGDVCHPACFYIQPGPPAVGWSSALPVAWNLFKKPFSDRVGYLRSLSSPRPSASPQSTLGPDRHQGCWVSILETWFSEWQKWLFISQIYSQLFS